MVQTKEQERIYVLTDGKQIFDKKSMTEYDFIIMKSMAECMTAGKTDPWHWELAKEQK